jgi:alanyl-tRNA synthetase
MAYQTDIRESTRIGFARGETEGRGRVLFAAREPDRLLVVTDATPAHPVSFRWPDQPSDTGVLAWSGTSCRMNEAMTGLVNSTTGELRIDDEAKALGRTGQEWTSVVVHVLDGAAAEIPAVGSMVDIVVDADRRGKLSAAHTAAHLSAFALNRALTPFWTKEGAAVDSLGSADFDKEAIVSSQLSYEGATDTYRLGKSLRKKGFDQEAAIGSLSAIVEEINGTLATWLAQLAEVTLDPAEALLDTRRVWRCMLDGRPAEMFCAGTHVAKLSALIEASVTIAQTEDGLQMKTIVRTA